MTKNQMEMAITKIVPNVPSSAMILEQLENADEGCIDELLKLRLKSRTASVLLSVFLGNFGAGWFYARNIGLGFGQIAVAIIANLFITLCTILLPPLGFIICDIILFILAFIWHLGNIFWALNNAKELNYKNICDLLYKHKNKTDDQVEAAANFEKSTDSDQADDEIQAAMSHFKNYVPAGSLTTLRSRLKKADKHSLNKLMYIKMKSVTTAILLAIFLGSFGAGRFYIGDKRQGIIRLLVPISVSIILGIFAVLLPGLWIIYVYGVLYAAIFAWHVTDIFLVAKKVKWNNYFKLSDFLTRQSNANGNNN